MRRGQRLPAGEKPVLVEAPGYVSVLVLQPTFIPEKLGRFTLTVDRWQLKQTRSRGPSRAPQCSQRRTSLMRSPTPGSRPPGRTSPAHPV